MDETVNIVLYPQALEKLNDNNKQMSSSDAGLYVENISLSLLLMILISDLSAPFFYDTEPYQVRHHCLTGWYNHNMLKFGVTQKIME